MSKSSSNKKEIEISLDRIYNFLEKYYAHLLLLFIFSFALYLRFMPVKYKYLLAIDPFYLSRMSHEVVINHFKLPHVDPLRYYPTYIDPHIEYTGIFAVPAAVYVFLTKVLRLHIIFMFTYAKIYPACLGALFTIFIYLIAKELKDRKAGLFAALFYATCTGIMYRTSGGFFEKEPNGGLMMLISLYFFIRALKSKDVRDTLLFSTISGLALALFGTIWGGAQMLYFSLTLFGVFMLFNNKMKGNFALSYAITTLLGTLLPTWIEFPVRFKSIAIFPNVFLAVLAILVYLNEKFGIVEDKKLNYYLPGLFIFSFFGLIVASFFSRFAARMLQGMHDMLFFKQGVIQSTVAENVIPHWIDFTSSLDLRYAEASFAYFSKIFHFFPLWGIAFIGLFLIVYRTFTNQEYLSSKSLEVVKSNERIKKILSISFILLIVSLFSYYRFMKLVGDYYAQMFFIFPLLFVLFLIARYGKPEDLILLCFTTVGMLGFLSFMRLMFFVALAYSIIGGFAISSLLDSYNSLTLVLQKREKLGISNIYDVCLGVILTFLIIGNLANGYVVAKGLAPSFNKPWAQAMAFLRNDTPKNATVLSWWDFGYWFETMGNRSSNLDGGNDFADRNIPTAQYFTGMMNLTQQKFFLEMMGTDYIIVDASMVGKFAAMSKIANFGHKIDAYMYFYYRGAYPQGNKTLMVYAYPYAPFFLWVPVDKDGRLAGHILMVNGKGRAYVKYLCTQNGTIPLPVPKNAAVIDGCVIPAGRVMLFANKNVMNSLIQKFYFYDGRGIPYVKEVFNNGVVKIFEVNHTIIPDLPRDKLVKWWDKYHWKGLIVYNGTARVNQKVDWSVLK